MAEIDKTLLEQNTALIDLYEKLQPLLQPPPDRPKRRIDFQPKGKPDEAQSYVGAHPFPPSRT
jgi:hypothetical protein